MSVRVLILLYLGWLGGLVVGQAQAQSPDSWRQAASHMVDGDVVAAGVTDARVIRVMRETPRHEFLPARQRPRAYYDMALPIGSQQTITSPFIVAYMTEQLDPQPTDRVLEIGTGSGYQAAVLSPLVKDVYTIEIIDALGRRAARTLKRLGYKNVHTRVGDGYLGWPDAAPFDKIIVTCSPEEVPQPLVDQLAEGGRMIVPVGERYQQNLYMFRKEDGDLKSEALLPVLFVPMTGQAEEQRDVQPDPARPAIVNGHFEETRKDGTTPTGWHYQRRMTLVTDGNAAPEGERFVTFRNEEPGLECFALQGFPVDGRKVAELEVTYSVRGQSIRHVDARRQTPILIATFYDERRAMIGEQQIGPVEGTFDWRKEKHVFRVPLKSREAILRIGLLGATGELSLDEVRLAPLP